MINPEEFHGAISSVRFLVGVAHGERQYTFAELFVKNRTTRELKMSFYVPNDSGAKDESALVRAMGGSPINDAMDAWGLMATMDDCQNHVSAVTFEDLDPLSTSCKVSGCNRMAWVTVPMGPCIVNACWSHAASSRAIFIPTQNEHLSEWCMDAIVIGGYAENSGKRPERPLSRAFRFDLAFTQQVIFGNLDNAILISRYSAALPFHNLWIPRTKPDPASREYFGISGTHLVDNTSLRAVTFYDVLFLTLPVVCGCFVRNSAFPDAFVPLTVVERVTRDQPIVFSDNPDGSKNIVMSIAGVPCYLIDPTQRVHFNSVDWVSLTPKV